MFLLDIEVLSICFSIKNNCVVMIHIEKWSILEEIQLNY